MKRTYRASQDLGLSATNFEIRATSSSGPLSVLCTSRRVIGSTSDTFSKWGVARQPTDVSTATAGGRGLGDGTARGGERGRPRVGVENREVTRCTCAVLFTAGGRGPQYVY